MWRVCAEPAPKTTAPEGEAIGSRKRPAPYETARGGPRVWDPTQADARISQTVAAATS